MKTLNFLPISGLLLIAVVTMGAQTPPVKLNAELESLGALIVGTWESPDSRHVHEWGVGRQLIRSQSFFLEGDDWKLVSEGMWYWDAEESVIRGIHFAIEMPVDRFDYRTKIADKEVIHELTAHGASIEKFVETWTFNEDSYNWHLERPTSKGYERVMGGAYKRTKNR